MTGSGKTGLCIALLEEAAIDGMPAIVIDPKGDLTNLLLTFPDLKAGDFAPWINEEDAEKQGLLQPTTARSKLSFGRTVWREWGQDGARIKRLKDAADFAHLYAGQQRRFVSFNFEIVCRTAGSDARRCRVDARSYQYYRHQSAWPARHRSRSNQKPRAHSDLQYFQCRVVQPKKIWTSPR